MNATAYKSSLKEILNTIIKSKANFDERLAELQKNTTQADSEAELGQIARDTLSLVLTLRHSLRENRQHIQAAKQQFETSQNEVLKVSLTN